MVAEAARECYNVEKILWKVMRVKKIIAALIALAAVMLLLSGCGMLLVEDSQPVEIGMDAADRTLTERC